MFEITMQNGEVNDTYYGTIEGAPANFRDVPGFLGKNQFILLLGSDGKELILNTKNIITIAQD